MRKVIFVIFLFFCLMGSAWAAMSDGDFAKLCANGSVQDVRAELLKGANPNAENSGRTALMWAVIEDTPEVVSLLLKAGANVNAKNKDGETALMVAAGNGNKATVNFLIDAGADDLIDNYGDTALIHASVRGNAETVNALIDAGSYVKQKDNSGKMAVDYARDNHKLKGTDALKRLEELSK